jgi:hypothetical protein
MPEEVTYDAGSKLIRVRAWGRDTIADWRKSQQQVEKLQAQHGATKLLVDVREQESAPSALEIFDFGADWPAEIQVAIVTGTQTRSEQYFLETVARNRGKKMRLFSNVEEALSWLGRS